MGVGPPPARLEAPVPRLNPRPTDAKLRNAKPLLTADGTRRARKVGCGQGLFLLVTPEGGKQWRFKYRLHGRERLLSLGTYPAVSLRQAEQRRDDLRDQLAAGADPSAARKAAHRAGELAGAATFEVVAREFVDTQTQGWTESHRAGTLRRLARDLFPFLGSRPVGALTPPEILATLRRIDARGATESAHRAKVLCGQVLRFAVATGRAERDVTADLKGALPPVHATPFAALTDPQEVGALLRALRGYQGSPVVRAALQLAPLVFVRPGELRTAEWAHLDLPGAEWRFTVSKTGTPHIVPLARQAVALLEDLRPRTGGPPWTGRGRWVFPGLRPARPLSNNAVLMALRTLGYGKDQMTGHGFRAMARTLLDEVLGFPPHLIEHQMAHVVRDPLGRSYNRTQHLPDRREMMQRWADYLDRLAGDPAGTVTGGV